MKVSSAATIRCRNGQISGQSPTVASRIGTGPLRRLTPAAPDVHPQACADTVDRVQPWDQTKPGVLRLPSGRLVRGRGMRNDVGEGVAPEFGLYLMGTPPPPTSWPSRWVRWPDWWLPVDRADARSALLELWERAPTERVEVACSGGHGRTGTALACLAVLDGVRPAEAVRYVRQNYNSRAVETLWQRRYVKQFQP